MEIPSRSGFKSNNNDKVTFKLFYIFFVFKYRCLWIEMIINMKKPKKTHVLMNKYVRKSRSDPVYLQCCSLYVCKFSVR